MRVARFASLTAEGDISRARTFMFYDSWRMNVSARLRDGAGLEWIGVNVAFFLMDFGPL